MATQLQKQDLVSRALHTFYQSFLGAFLVLVTDFLGVVQHGGLSAGKSAVGGLLAGVVGAAVSAVKTALVQNVGK